MIALRADDTKLFMNKLLKSDVFDAFYIASLDLDMRYRLSIEGSVNKDFLTDEEKDEALIPPYVTWAEVKPGILEHLKGKRQPTGLKIIFILHQEATAKILERHPSFIGAVKGFNLSVTYAQQQVKIVTGTNYVTFVPDKTMEQAYDTMMTQFLNKNDIVSTPL